MSQHHAMTPAESSPARERSRMRWAIVTMSALGLTIAYLDRSALSVAMPHMAEDFHIDKAIQGVLLSSFFWTYAIFQLPSGWLLDRFGPRLIYPLAVGWWSIWTTLTAIAQGATAVLVFRLGLGIGEAPVQPANVKVVSQWHPRKERAFASSLFDMGQQIGVALSVPVVTALSVVAGWRAAFVVIGVIGFLWALGWYRIYRSPQNHPRVSPAELDYIEAGGAARVAGTSADSHGTGSGASAAEGAKVSWWSLLRHLSVWGLVLGYICRSSAGAFFLTWYPSYLLEERGFSEAQFGIFGSLPALLAVGATVLGGIVSDRWLAKGMSPSRARKIPIISGLALSAMIALTPLAPNNLVVMVLLIISNSAHSFAGAAILSLPAEVATSPNTVGSLAGLQNFGSQVGNIISPILIGFFLSVSNNSYVGPMIFAGAMALLGALIYGFMVQIRPLPGSAAENSPPGPDGPTREEPGVR